jgi:radical SAM protein with 4Fe4S-binding SPASM domain
MTHAPFVLTPQHFGSIVFERHSSRFVPFDVEATNVLRALTQQSFFELMGERPPEAHDGLEAFYAALDERGWFTADGRFAGRVNEVEHVPADHLVGPLAVHVEVVGACNLACTHCFADPLPRNRELLSLAEYATLFADLAAMGSFRLGLTGGEPLMRRELLEVIDVATSAGLHPCLTTNGLLLDEAWARALGHRELVWLNVSLDGASAATNDAVRGRGTFEAVTAKLRELGHLFRFTLAFTVMKHNAHEVPAFAQLARELGAANVVFRPLYPAGAARHRPELLPGFGQYSDALLSLEALGSVRGIDPFSPTARADANAVVYGNFGCGAGNSIASISARGDVNPCSFLGTAFDAANVRERSFREIWNDSERFRAMRALSKRPGPGEFNGGCRARSLRLAGDVNAPDPWQAEWEARREQTVRPGFTLPVLG